MSHQRRHGQTCKVFPVKYEVDARGNKHQVLDEAHPITVRAAVIPQRSARAEVPGQTEINVVRMIVDPNLHDVTLWSQVEFQGSRWDVVTPPAYHHGTRHSRHWSLDLRKRPS